jgi:hypothetical protein
MNRGRGNGQAIMTERPVHKRKMKLFGSRMSDNYCSVKNAVLGRIVKGKGRESRLKYGINIHSDYSP